MNSEQNNVVVTPPGEETARHQAAYNFAWRYAQLQKQQLIDLMKNTAASGTFTRYTKEQLMQYMQAPGSNEKNIRNASIYMYDASNQYRRLIQYYANMFLWAYNVVPLDFDRTKVKPEAFRKAYLKAVSQLDMMNLKHEFQKAVLVALREGVFYGVQWSGSNSYFIQRINPDICRLSSITDGTWLYAVDFSQIKEADLMLYPPEFTVLYNQYKANTKQKWLEIPESISFCLKADETTSAYSIPPWASTLPMLYDIDTFKSLQETAGEIANYKMIGLEIPVDDDGTPKMDYDLALQYYEHMVNALPPYVGAFMAPMKASAYSFDKSGNLNDVDTVSRSEEQFWREGGTSPLLFGSADNDSAGALKLSILADEEIVLALANQCERIVNRILKQMSGSIKFKINFLPVTRFNQGDWIDHYKGASALGIPVKSSYAAVLGLNPNDVVGLNYAELEMLGMGELTPLVSGYTQSSAGRPATDEGDLTESGTQTRDSGANENR